MMQTIHQMLWGVPRARFRGGPSLSGPIQSADVVGYFRLLFAFGIFPNIPFLVAPRLLHVSARGLVNVEYLAVGVMACVLPRIPAFAALVLAMAFDIGARSFFVFYFSQRDLSSSLKYLSLVPLNQSLWMGALLVESYGQLLDDAVSSALAVSYNRTELKSRYRLETGAVRFRGGTVSGELRELCGISANLSAVPLTENVTTGCLPALLQKRGYRSTAIHGYVGEMFGREHWYPKLGFRESLFREDLEKHREIHDCHGFFEGACDADVARFIHSLLLARRESPQFVYWVTLNSHLPVPSSIAVDRNFECDGNGIRDQDVCLWARLIFNVNKAIAEVASDPAIGPTEFLVVGDHGPPFWRTTRRSLFSQTHVPYFRLIPRK